MLIIVKIIIFYVKYILMPVLITFLGITVGLIMYLFIRLIGEYLGGARMNLDRFFAEEHVRHKADKQETKVAKSIGGKKTIGSGCLPFSKGDVFKKGLRIECKRTDKLSISIKKDWLFKLKEQTLINEVPAFHLEIQDEDWYLVRPEEFAYILEKLKGE